MLRFALLIISVLMTGAGAAAFYGRYFRWRDCFNELGRCFDGETGAVYLQQAGLVWGMFTVFGAVLTGLLLRNISRRRGR